MPFFFYQYQQSFSSLSNYVDSQENSYLSNDVVGKRGCFVDREDSSSLTEINTLKVAYLNPVLAGMC
jgi:hypothetical protein